MIPVRKAFKIFGVAISFIFVIVFFGGLWALWKMPSAGELGRVISKNNKATQPLASAPSKALGTVSSSEKLDMANNNNAPVASAENKGSSTQFMGDLMDATIDKSQVCSQLLNYQMLPAHLKYDGPTLGKHLEEAMSAENNPKDPVAMAILAPLRLFFQQPKVQDLIKITSQAAEKGEKDSLLEKANFYKHVYSAFEEMKLQKGSAEALMDRGYYLIMMAKAIQKNPSLATDPRLQDYCQNIEKAANDSFPINSEIEKSEFLSFLDYSKIKPSEIGYDPNYKTQLQFEYSTEGIRIHGGWIESLLQ